MALPSSFLEELRARTPMAPLVGRRVKLARSGRQWKGCCPFHDEKTPSFYVYDDGFHCFGCGAHGDAVGFVMRAEGASFLEAVGRLAGEAGLDVPKPTPEAAAAEQRRLDLHGVLQAACALFQRRLRATAGAAALGYLRQRGIVDSTIEAFGLGWSGEGRALESELDAPAQLLADAGLMSEAADGRRRGFFFDRVMFPIRDAQGRVIGFGGRTLGDGQPKYLNGPETALFSKRRTLFGLDRARAAARDGGQIIVVEGYLDVIALHQSGFGGALAPLGTALTGDQLGLLWRLTPAPILCFDGDAAGARAAERTIMLALPALIPANSLGVARLPAGEDPDSFVRSAEPGRGAAGFRAVLDSPPLWQSLYEILRQGARTPEQRAGFRERLETAAKSIRHPGLASEYRRAMLDRFFSERRGPRAQKQSGTLARPVPSQKEADFRRGAIVVGLLLNHPVVLHDEEELVARLELPGEIETLRQAMLAWLPTAETLEAAALMDHLRVLGQEEPARRLLASVASTLPAEARSTATTAEAAGAFHHFAGLCLRRSSLEREVAQAERATADRLDDASVRRLEALREEQSRLYSAGPAAT